MEEREADHFLWLDRQHQMVRSDRQQRARRRFRAGVVQPHGQPGVGDKELDKGLWHGFTDHRAGFRRRRRPDAADVVSWQVQYAKVWAEEGDEVRLDGLQPAAASVRGAAAHLHESALKVAQVLPKRRHRWFTRFPAADRRWLPGIESN